MLIALQNKNNHISRNHRLSGSENRPNAVEDNKYMIYLLKETGSDLEMVRQCDQEHAV